jgi:hypothetical protein
MFVPHRTPSRGKVIQRSIDLVGICWTLASQHPKLLLAHTLPLSASFLAGWEFIVPQYFHAGISRALTGILLLLGLASLGIVAGNAVLIVGAQRVLAGEQPSLREGFRVAFSRTRQLVGWVIISALVGTLIKVIQGLIERVSPLGGSVFGATAGISWGLTTYFVLPLMVIEGQGPIEALRSSAGLAEKSWVRQVLGDVSLGLAFLLLAIPGLFLVWVVWPSPMGFGLALLYFAPLCMSYGVATAIYQAALYRFALTGEVPQHFEPVFAPEVKRTTTI